jgi:hypothetical protein
MTAAREAPTFQLALAEDEKPPLQAAVIGALVGLAFYALLFGLCVLVLL